MIEERNPFEAQAHEIARNFYVTYERYARPYSTGPQEHSTIWDDVPQETKGLMIAVVKKLLIDGVIEAGVNLRWITGT